MYAVFHGPNGLRAIAERVHGADLNACISREVCRARRVAQVVVNGDFSFDTITVEVGVGQAGASFAQGPARAEGLNLRKIGTAHVGISLDRNQR